jgi:hypothetical protein
MRRRLAFVTAVVAITIGAFRLAAGAQAPQPPQAPKPGPEHQRLAYFVGTWTGEGEMMASPMGPAGKMTGKDVCEWYEGHFAVICRSESKSPMGASKSLAVMTYSAEEKVYTYYATDSSGAMTMTSIPKGTVTGDTWTYTDEGLMGGQKVKSRVTLKEVSPKSYTFLMELQGPDGKWMTLMKSTSTKVK